MSSRNAEGAIESPWTPEFTTRFRMGHAATLDELYALHAPDVARVARRFLKARHLAEVEDVVQEVFSKVFSPNVRSAFDGSRRFGPYVSTLARNLVIDWTRKRGRELVVDDSGSLADEGACDLTSCTAETDVRHAIRRCVARLPSRLRRLYELRYVEEKTQGAACATLGISRQELRTRELHLLQSIRREIKRNHWDVASKRRAIGTNPC